MSSSIEPSTGILLNKNFDQVLENSIRLESKVNELEEVTQKEVERFETLLKDVDKSSNSIEPDEPKKTEKKTSPNKKCRCQSVSKKNYRCKCGDNCQCGKPLTKTTKQTTDNTDTQVKDSSIKKPIKTKNKRIWTFPWGRRERINVFYDDERKVKTEPRKKEKNKKENIISRRKEKRSLLTGELSPTSPKDREMMEMFSENDKHSIHERLLYPYSPTFSFSTSPTDNNDDENNNIGNNNNKLHTQTLNSNIVITEREKRESYFSSDDYNLIRKKTAEKYEKLSNREKNRTTKNENKLKRERKRVLLKKFWSRFVSRSSKVNEKKNEESENIVKENTNDTITTQYGDKEEIGNKRIRPKESPSETDEDFESLFEEIVSCEEGISERRSSRAFTL